MTNVSKNFTGHSLRIWQINSHQLTVTMFTRWLYHILITIRGQMVHKRPDKESKHGRDMLCVTRPASSSHNTNPILPGPGPTGGLLIVPGQVVPGHLSQGPALSVFTPNHQSRRAVAGTWPSPPHYCDSYTRVLGTPHFERGPRYCQDTTDIYWLPDI